MNDSMHINFLLEPIVDSNVSQDAPVLNDPLKMVITIRANTLVKHVGNELLRKIKLQHLVCNSETFVRFPKENSFQPMLSYFSPNATIGCVRAVLGEYLTIKMRVKGAIENFTGLQERNNLYFNLLQHLLKKHPYIREVETNPVVMRAIDSITDRSFFSLQRSQLHLMNHVFERQLYMLERNLEPLYDPGYPPIDYYNSESSATINMFTSTMNGNSNLYNTLTLPNISLAPSKPTTKCEIPSNEDATLESIEQFMDLFNATENPDENGFSNNSQFEQQKEEKSDDDSPECIPQKRPRTALDSDNDKL